MVIKRYRGKSRKLFLRRKRTTNFKKGGGLRKSNLIKLIKNVSLKQTETKNVSMNAENVQLNHNGGNNNWINYGNLCRTVLGDGQSNRSGDVIHPVGLSFRVWLSNKADRPNVMYRLYVVAVPPDQATSGSPSNFFSGLSGNKIIDYINTDKYSVVYHKIIKSSGSDYSLESGATNKEKSTFHKFYIPLKRKGLVSYSSEGGEVPKYQKFCLSFGVLAYDATGTLSTDTIASYSYNCKFYFKDP